MLLQSAISGQISSRFAALENFDGDDEDDMVISGAWEFITESKETSATESGYYELKTCFDEECS